MIEKSVEFFLVGALTLLLLTLLFLFSIPLVGGICTLVDEIRKGRRRR